MNLSYIITGTLIIGLWARLLGVVMSALRWVVRP